LSIFEFEATLNMKYSVVLILILLFLSGCEKELSLENGKLPKTFRKYQLKAFYSDVPIDFLEYDDEVRYETDLWAYVNDYIKDDINVFTDSSTALAVYQNEIKMPGLDDPIIYTTYFIGKDNEGPYMRYLTNEYKPLRYRLIEINEDYFILGLKWRQGAMLFSRFERVR
jgi:hypothetical protein